MRASNPRGSYPYEALKEIKGLEEEIERLTRANRTAGNCNDALAKSCDNLKAENARLTQERDHFEMLYEQEKRERLNALEALAEATR